MIFSIITSKLTYRIEIEKNVSLLLIKGDSTQFAKSFVRTISARRRRPFDVRRSPRIRPIRESCSDKNQGLQYFPQETGNQYFADQVTRFNHI